MDTILLLICDPIPVLSFCLSNVLECISPSSPGFIQELHVMFSRLISSVSFNVGQFFSLSLSLPHWHIWWTRPFILQNAPQFGFVWFLGLGSALWEGVPHRSDVQMVSLHLMWGDTCCWLAALLAMYNIDHLLKVMSAGFTVAELLFYTLELRGILWGGTWDC